MNKERKKRIADIMLAVSNAKENLELVLQEEEEYRDNMPESIFNGSKGDAVEENVSALEDAREHLDSVIEELGDKFEIDY